MSWARDKVFAALLADPALIDLGVTEAGLFPNFAPDSPAGTLQRFWILRWGAAEPPVGRDASSRAVAMSLWAYDREKHFSNIEAMLKRSRDVFRTLEGFRDPGGAGAITAIDFSFSSEDLWDDSYGAVGRSETYKVVASGL